MVKGCLFPLQKAGMMVRMHYSAGQPPPPSQTHESSQSECDSCWLIVKHSHKNRSHTLIQTDTHTLTHKTSEKSEPRPLLSPSTVSLYIV